MRRVKLFVIGLLFLIFLFSSVNDAVIFRGQDPTVARTNEHKLVPADSYTPHGPIIITGDADFSSQGWPGNGTVEDPYLIKGLNITSDAICINITDTTAYFKIQDCVISSVGYSFNYGIVLENTTHGLIQNCTIEHHSFGIYLLYSPHTTLSNNTVSNNFHGFYVRVSNDCTLRNNTAINNEYGFHVRNSDNCTLVNNTATSNQIYGVYLAYSTNCVLKNNTLVYNGVYITTHSIPEWLHDLRDNWVNGKPLGYFKSVNNISIDGSQYGQVILANCSDVTVSDGTFTYSSAGIQLGFCMNCSMTNNIVSNNYYGFNLYSSINCTLINNIANDNLNDGFHLYYSDNCTLISNIAAGNSGYGFWVVFSDNCTLTHNNITDNDLGLYVRELVNCNLMYNTVSNNHNGFKLYSSSNCTLTNNIANDNTYDGFRLDYSDNCTLMSNIAAGNSDHGIYLDENSDHNILYLNKLGHNSESNAWDSGSFNNWDNGVSSGNYWMDYNGTGTYLVPGSAGSIDEYPFVWDTTLPTIDSPSDLEYIEGDSDHSISWTPGDAHPVSYVVYLDGVPVKSGAWNSSSEVITISVDGLSLGTYNYTIVVTDIGGNTASDTVIVTVAEVSTTSTTTTTTTTTETSIPTSTTTSTGTTPGGFDSMIQLVIGGVGAIAVLVIVFVFLKKKS